MIQRLSLATWPDPRPFRYVDAVPNAAALAHAVELLRRLDALEPVDAGAVLLAGDTIPAFHFDEAAQELFVDWLTTWQHGLDTSDESPALVQHLAKYRKLYPTLALLFHLLDVVSGASAPGPITPEATQLAGQWCDYFAAHARRLYANARADKTDRTPFVGFVGPKKRETALASCLLLIATNYSLMQDRSPVSLVRTAKSRAASLVTWTQKRGSNCPTSTAAATGKPIAAMP